MIDRSTNFQITDETLVCKTDRGSGVVSLSGCEFMKCKYYMNGKCTDPNEWVNENGDAVCGLRTDAILVENEHSI